MFDTEHDLTSAKVTTPIISTMLSNGKAAVYFIICFDFHTIQACHFKDKSDVEKSKQMMITNYLLYLLILLSEKHEN